MVKRKKNQRSRRRGGSGITPGISSRILFTGNVAPNGVLAFNIAAKPGFSTYRVQKLSGTFTSTGTGIIQMAIRGENDSETESNYSPVQVIGHNVSRINVRQPKMNGYWTPSKESEHVGWIRNIGMTAVQYALVAFVSSKTELNVPARLEYMEVDPVFT